MSKDPESIFIHSTVSSITRKYTLRKSYNSLPLLFKPNATLNTGRQYLLLSLGEVQLFEDFIFVSVYIGQPLFHFLQTEHPLSLNRKPNYMYIIHYLKHRINSHLTENKNSFSPILGKKNTVYIS